MVNIMSRKSVTIDFALDKFITTEYNLIVIKRVLTLGVKGGCL